MLIERENLLTRIDKLYQLYAINGLGLEPVMAIRDIKAMIFLMPEVDAVPVKHGRWMTYKYDEKQYRNVIIPLDGKGLPHDIFCSECRTPALLNGHEEDVDSNYCPRCGAKMDLEEQCENN